MTACVIVMAKAPLAGCAKTRLQREMGLADDEIVRLASAFVLDTLTACHGVNEARIRVHFAPPEGERALRDLAPDVELVPQADGDLGARMIAAIDAAFSDDCDRVAVIGTDMPQIASATLQAAFDGLTRVECVLGPAEDGGYWLIGLRTRRPELFAGIEWSTPRVFEQTLERVRAAAVTHELLAPDFDIDGAADVARLRQAIARGGALCEATRIALESLARSD